MMVVVTLRCQESGVEIGRGSGSAWQEPTFGLYNDRLSAGLEPRGLLHVVDDTDPKALTVRFARRLEGTSAIALDPKVRVEIDDSHR